jgi:hypothetical protein
MCQAPSTNFVTVPPLSQREKPLTQPIGGPHHHAAMGTTSQTSQKERAKRALLRANQVKKERLETGIAPATSPEVLRANQLRAITALMSGKNYTQAAKEAGVHPRTLQLWLRDDADFVKEYKAQAEECRQHVLANIKAGMTEAANVVRKSLKSRNEGRRLAAARILMSSGATIVKQADGAEAAAMVPLFALPPGTQVGFAIPAPPAVETLPPALPSAPDLLGDVVEAQTIPPNEVSTDLTKAG